LRELPQVLLQEPELPERELRVQLVQRELREPGLPAGQQEALPQLRE
jgi:hypothetical protein